MNMNNNYIDFVIPNNNELEFMEIAEKLSYHKICFLYDTTNQKSNIELSQIKTKIESLHKKDKSSKNQGLKINKKPKIEIFYGYIVNSKTINIYRQKGDICVFKLNNTPNPENTQQIIEKLKPDLIFNQENHHKSDFIHQRNSGLNHIICNITSQKKLGIGFSFEQLLNKKLQTRIIGRFWQNIMLTKKFNNLTLIGSFADSPYKMRSPNDLTSLFVSMGMESKKAKESLCSGIEIIKKNKKKKSPNYISEGIEIVDD